MKRYYKILVLAFVLVAAFISCEEYLDVSPEMGISTEEVFTDYYSTRGVVDRANHLIQNYVYAQSDHSSEIGVLSDECQISQVSNGMHSVVNSGNWMNFTGREFGGMTYDGTDEEFDNNDLSAEAVSTRIMH
ncbi:hypothetical protein [Mangrovibacterium sp.]|uniref:hypothetical protein n=1 Tax=Mangrovibacterium sp. TaxID=1961364 RepID=UPI0035693031